MEEDIEEEEVPGWYVEGEVTVWEPTKNALSSYVTVQAASNTVIIWDLHSLQTFYFLSL